MAAAHDGYRHARLRDAGELDDLQLPLRFDVQALARIDHPGRTRAASHAIGQSISWIPASAGMTIRRGAIGYGATCPRSRVSLLPSPPGASWERILEATYDGRGA
jgi:hypothetical protein